MNPVPDTSDAVTIAVLGGTGPFGRAFIREFAVQGVGVRILARKPGPVAARFPGVEVLRGSMLDVAGACRAMAGAKGALLITPVGGNDNTAIELRAARVAVAAARRVCLPHLIYVSLIQPSHPTGVPMLDVKRDIERLIAASGIPWSSLRTGCYMDAWLAFLRPFMKRGFYLFPINSRHRFSFTSEPDVARAATLLMRYGQILYGAVDVIEPRARTLQEVARAYEAATGCRLRLLGHWFLPVLKALQPLAFRWAFPTGASRVGLLDYFDRHDWIGDPDQASKMILGFHPTGMERHLKTRQKFL